MPVQMPKKREDFINEAVTVLQAFAKSKGVGGISKESLAIIVQRYNKRFKPTDRPRPAKKGLQLVGE